MSRSRRKSPIAGVTAAPSDKRSKTASNHSLRQALKRAMVTAPDSPPPTREQLMNRWSMAKEGKLRFDPADDPKRMRK